MKTVPRTFVNAAGSSISQSSENKAENLPAAGRVSADVRFFFTNVLKYDAERNPTLKNSLNTIPVIISFTLKLGSPCIAKALFAAKLFNSSQTRKTAPSVPLSR